MKIFLLCVSALCMGGCATITHDSTQSVKIETLTPDGHTVTSADCTLSNDFSTTLGKSGSSVQVHRSSQNLAISCVSAGNPAATGTAISRANAGLAGNIILGGAIGAIIDHNKGAAYSYPSWIKLVFGQTRVFDRQNETDGVALLGIQPNTSEEKATGIAAAPQPQSENKTIQPGFIASGFARIDDIDAIPYLSDKGRNDYREWLAKSTPRAFAIAPNGWHAWTWGLKPRDPAMPIDPSERALLICERGAKQPCKLYAVNGSVVWSRTTAPAGTIGATPTSPE